MVTTTTKISTSSPQRLNFKKTLRLLLKRSESLNQESRASLPLAVNQASPEVKTINEQYLYKQLKSLFEFNLLEQ
jgi:hypothetical protein